MNKKFNWRNFISLYIAFSFIIMFISGIVLYIAPPGRIANWSYWAILGLTKKDWQSIHIIFTFIFVLIGGFHIYYNWKPLMFYLKTKKQNINFLRTELIAVLTVGTLIFVLTVKQSPPLNFILDFGEYLTDSWESEDNTPPASHTERLTLQELSNTYKIPVQKIESEFKKSNINYSALDNTLEDIALINNVTPQILFSILNPDNEFENHKISSGKGIGRQTIEDICLQNNLNVNDVLNKLLSHNIQAERLSKIKDIANDNNKLPVDIYNLIFEEVNSK